jgi:hypothetical protein
MLRERLIKRFVEGDRTKPIFVTNALGSMNPFVALEPELTDVTLSASLVNRAKQPEATESVKMADKPRNSLKNAVASSTGVPLAPVN